VVGTHDVRLRRERAAVGENERQRALGNQPLECVPCRIFRHDASRRYKCLYGPHRTHLQMHAARDHNSSDPPQGSQDIVETKMIRGGIVTELSTRKMRWFTRSCSPSFVGSGVTSASLPGAFAVIKFATTR